MTVTAVHKDPDALTMTLTAEFDASPERVWELWADPRQLERWWGPPTYPATFTKHDLAPGSRVEYHMTGPEGDQPKEYLLRGPAAPELGRIVDAIGSSGQGPCDSADLPVRGEGQPVMVPTLEQLRQGVLEQRKGPGLMGDVGATDPANAPSESGPPPQPMNPVRRPARQGPHTFSVPP